MFGGNPAAPAPSPSELSPHTFEQWGRNPQRAIIQTVETDRTANSEVHVLPCAETRGEEPGY